MKSVLGTFATLGILTVVALLVLLPSLSGWAAPSGGPQAGNTAYPPPNTDTPTATVTRTATATRTSTPAASATNTRTPTPTPLTGADITLFKTGPSSAVPGSTIFYRLDLHNAGPQSTTATITDTLDADVLYLTYLPGPSGITCGTPLSGNLVCQVPSVAPGATRSVTVSVQIDAAALGWVLNTAYAVSPLDPLPAVAIRVQTILGTATPTPLPTSTSTPTPTSTPWGTSRLYLPVILYNGLGNLYTPTPTGTPTCMDLYEPNDIASQAYPQPPAAPPSNIDYQARFCASEQNDWYRFHHDTGNGARIEAWLVNIPAGSDYNLYLYDGNVTLLAQSVNGGNSAEHILSNNLPTGNYYVQVQVVTNPSAANYALQVNSAP